MNPIDVNSIIDELKIGAIDAARKVAVNMAHEAAIDATAFVTIALPSIGRYLGLYASKQISEDEFKSLMLGLLQYAEMTGLTQAGLAAIEVDRTRNTVLKTVTDIALGAVGKII